MIVAGALERIHSILDVEPLPEPRRGNTPKDNSIVLENVRLSRLDATRQKAERVLHNAQCGEIIAKLPDGIDTVTGTKGVYLSGGEQQRIAITRVMLKNAQVLILDEATVFADPENEVLVQRAFERFSKRKDRH